MIVALRVKTVFGPQKVLILRMQLIFAASLALFLKKNQQRIKSIHNYIIHLLRLLEGTSCIGPCFGLLIIFRV